MVDLTLEIEAVRREAIARQTAIAAAEQARREADQRPYLELQETLTRLADLESQARLKAYTDYAPDCASEVQHLEADRAVFNRHFEAANQALKTCQTGSQAVTVAQGKLRALGEAAGLTLDDDTPDARIPFSPMRDDMRGITWVEVVSQLRSAFFELQRLLIDLETADLSAAAQRDCTHEAEQALAEGMAIAQTEADREAKRTHKPSKPLPKPPANAIPLLANHGRLIAMETANEAIEDPINAQIARLKAMAARLGEFRLPGPGSDRQALDNARIDSHVIGRMGVLMAESLRKGQDKP